MKVCEIIKYLETCDGNATVVVRDDYDDDCDIHYIAYEKTLFSSHESEDNAKVIIYNN